MEQIKFVRYKISDDKLELHLADNNGNICIWEIKTPTRIRGYKNKCFHSLRRTLYDTAYAFTEDPYERNVIMDSLWYIFHEDMQRWVWVPDGFINKLNDKYN